MSAPGWWCWLRRAWLHGMVRPVGRWQRNYLSHILRNRLQAMMGVAAFLARAAREGNAEQVAHGARLADEEVTRLAAVIEELGI